MAESKLKKITLFQDLKNRRVPQFIGIYLASSWGVIQFIIWLVNEFMLSPVLPQFTFVVLASMLPTVILLAYFHGSPGKDKWTRVEKIGVPLNLIVTVFLLIMFFQGKELGAADQKVTIKDEIGNTIERTIIKNQFRKKIAIFGFENASNDTSWNWLRYAIPSLLDYDLSQDVYMEINSLWDFTEQIRRAEFSPQEKLPLTLKLKLAKDTHYNFMLSGTYRYVKNVFEVIVRLHDVKTGKQITQNDFTGENFFEIIDKISIQLKYDLELPEKYLEIVKDLPVSEITTSSLLVYKTAMQGMNSLILFNNTTKAIRLLETAIQEDPLCTMAQYMLAKIYINSGDVNNYKEKMKKVMKRIYNLPEKHQYEAKYVYYMLDEQMDKSLAVLKMWTDLYPEDIEPHEYLCSFYKNKANDINLAISEVQCILGIDPSQYRYIRVLGGLYEEKGDYEQALYYYEKYLEYFPKNIESFKTIGNLYENRGEFEKARDYYDKALIIEPGNSGIIDDLGDIEKRIGKFQEAEKLYTEALENCQTPQQKRIVYNSLSGLYEMQGQIYKAISYSKLEIEERQKYQDPLSYQFQEQFMYLKYIQVGKKQIAFKKLKNMNFEPPLDKFIPFFYLVYYAELEDIENMEIELIKVNELVKSFGQSFVQNYIIGVKGKLKELRKEYKDAIQVYMEFLKNEPGNIDVSVRVGKCYKELKEYDKSIKSINNALKRMPVKAEAFYELALVYLEMGDKPKAIESLNKSMEIWKNADPEYKPAIKARQKLEELSKEIS